MKQVQFPPSNKKHNVIIEAGDYYILESKPSNWSDAYQVAVLKSAVKVIEEYTYYIGQRFNIGYDEYIIAQVGSSLVALILLQTGNRLREPIKVANPYVITKDELSLMGAFNLTLTK